MSAVFAALTRAGRNLFAPSILALVLLPACASLLLWTLLAWLFWGAWTAAITAVLASTTVAGWLQDWHAGWLIDYTAVALVLAGIVPAMMVTALVITEIIAMPAILAFVSSRDYPALERRHGGTLAGSLLNAAVAITVFIVLWLVTLPLWLTGIGAVLAPVLTSAWLNQRLFRYDALAEHADRAEFARIVQDSRGDLFLLGLLLSLLLYVPVLNLLLPVFSALAFTHFALARLAKIRNI